MPGGPGTGSARVRAPGAGLPPYTGGGGGGAGPTTAFGPNGPAGPSSWVGNGGTTGTGGPWRRRRVGGLRANGDRHGHGRHAEFMPMGGAA